MASQLDIQSVKYSVEYIPLIYFLSFIAIKALLLYGILL